MKQSRTFSNIYTELSFQIIYDALENLETAITFSKMNVLHNSIIDSAEFLHGVKSMNKDLKLGKLPFQPELENIWHSKL